jgi:hypothetical protein
MICVVPGWTSVNQEIPSLHVMDSEVVPVLVIVTEADLLGDPTAAAKARLGGLTMKLDVELDGRTVNDTGRAVFRVPPFEPISIMMTLEE